MQGPRGDGRQCVLTQALCPTLPSVGQERGDEGRMTAATKATTCLLRIGRWTPDEPREAAGRSLLINRAPNEVLCCLCDPHRRPFAATSLRSFAGRSAHRTGTLDAGKIPSAPRVHAAPCRARGSSARRGLAASRSHSLHPSRSVIVHACPRTAQPAWCVSKHRAGRRGRHRHADSQRARQQASQPTNQPTNQQASSIL